MSNFSQPFGAQVPLPKLSKATAWKWPRFIPLNDDPLNKSSTTRSQSTSAAEAGRTQVEVRGYVIGSESADQALSSRSSLLSENQPILSNVAASPTGKDGEVSQKPPSQPEVDLTSLVGSTAPRIASLSALLNADEVGPVTSSVTKETPEVQPGLETSALASASREAIGEGLIDLKSAMEETSDDIPDTKQVLKSDGGTQPRGPSIGVNDPTTQDFAAPRKPNGPQGQPGLPMISIQKPSRETSEAGPTNECSRNIKAEPKGDSTGAIKQNSSISVAETETDKSDALTAIPAQPAQPEPENIESPLAGKPKPKGLVLPKIRNILVRKTYLKVTLGRRLASPIKEALRYQAQGLDTTIAEIQVVE